MMASIALKAASGFLLARVMVKVSAVIGEVVAAFQDGTIPMSQRLTLDVLASMAMDLMLSIQAAFMATAPDDCEFPFARRVPASAAAFGAVWLVHMAL